MFTTKLQKSQHWFRPGTRILIDFRRVLLRHRTLWILFVLGSIAEIIYAFYFVASFYLPYYYNTPLLDLGKITQYRYDAAWKFVGAFSALFLLYYCAYRSCIARNPSHKFYAGNEEDLTPAMPHPGSNRSQVLLVILFSLLFSTTLILIYPIGAADVFDYIFHGRILVYYHQNPFSSVIADYPNDPLYPYPAWKAAPSAYGPVWILLSFLPSALAGDDLLLNLLYYKGLLAGFLILTVFLIYRTLRRLAPHYALPGTLLLAWNPLVLYETSGNGHNDIVMAFFVVLGIYFLSSKRQSLSVLAIVASGLMKFITGFLAPLFVISIVRRMSTWHSRAAFVASVFSLSALLSVALYAPFWIGPEMLGIERRQELFTASLPTLAMLGLSPSLGEESAKMLVAVISTLLFAAVLIWHAVRVGLAPTKLIESSFESLYAYLLFFCLWFQPWYLIWVIPLASAIPRLDIANRTVLFSYTAILSYFVFIFLWIWNANEFDALAVQGRAVVVIYPLPILLTAQSLVANRVATGTRASPDRGVDGTNLRVDRSGDDERSLG